VDTSLFVAIVLVVAGLLTLEFRISSAIVEVVATFGIISALFAVPSKSLSLGRSRLRMGVMLSTLCSTRNISALVDEHVVV